MARQPSAPRGSVRRSSGANRLPVERCRVAVTNCGLSRLLLFICVLVCMCVYVCVCCVCLCV